MPGSSIAINGANAISAVCVVYRCQVAFLRAARVFALTRSSRPAAWACMHWTGRWNLPRWDKIIWLFPEPRSSVYVRNSGPSAALPEQASLPLGTMCATQARPRLNSTPHSRGRRRPQRETIFCRPLMRKLTSFFRTLRRFRLAATPCGVSATGQGDDGMGARCGENRARCFLL